MAIIVIKNDHCRKMVVKYSSEHNHTRSASLHNCIVDYYLLQQHALKRHIPFLLRCIQYEHHKFRFFEIRKQTPQFTQISINKSLFPGSTFIQSASQPISLLQTTHHHTPEALGCSFTPNDTRLDLQIGLCATTKELQHAKTCAST